MYSLFYRRYTVRETDNADLKLRTKYKQFQTEMWLRLTNKNIQSQITVPGFYKEEYIQRRFHEVDLLTMIIMNI